MPSAAASPPVAVDRRRARRTFESPAERPPPPRCGVRAPLPGGTMAENDKLEHQCLVGWGAVRAPTRDDLRIDSAVVTTSPTVWHGRRRLRDFKIANRSLSVFSDGRTRPRRVRVARARPLVFSAPDH